MWLHIPYDRRPLLNILRTNVRTHNLCQQVDFSYILFIHLIQKPSGNIFLEHLGRKILQTLTRTRPTMVCVPRQLLNFCNPLSIAKFR